MFLLQSKTFEFVFPQPAQPIEKVSDAPDPRPFPLLADQNLEKQLSAISFQPSALSASTAALDSSTMS